MLTEALLVAGTRTENQWGGDISAILHAFSSGRREYLLTAIRALLPVIARLGGMSALRQTAQAIADTAAWWP